MPPWKSYANSPGATADDLYYFLQNCFQPNPKGNNFRNQFFDPALTEDSARVLLMNNRIFVPQDDGGKPPNPIRLMFVDVQNAQVWQDPKKKKIDPVNDLFYLLVMPPTPQKYDPEMQAWESAWYHAIVDGYGM
jgi:hypothetical protein